MNKQQLIAFEKKIKIIYEKGKIKAPIHLSGNNETQLINIFKKVKKSDWVFSTWRNHYHALLKGIPAKWLETEIINDVGVTGIHRILGKVEKIKKADCVVVVAGMEGALPTVVAGLVDKPVIAVPTSVGFGTGEKGYSALLTMLNSCAPGISVVNIDAGFSAGYQAGLIAKK